MIELPILYKYTSTGKTQMWKISINGDHYWTEEGILYGKTTRSQPTICQGKNTGKANRTSDSQQAVLEATAKWEKKVRSGYNEVLTKEKKFFEPMLAFELKQYEKLLFTVPTFIQPKLDGVRCILQNRELRTRAGKPIVSCPHIADNGSFLDGELYNHDLKNDFNKIISLTRKTKPTSEDITESKEMIEYWVYDNPGIKAEFSQRYNNVVEYFRLGLVPHYFKLVPTYVIESMDDIQKYHSVFISQGYEGSIIRLDLGGYENKRSKQLLKYKNWQDAEWEIIGVLEGTGNRAGCANMLVIRLESGVICKPTMTGTEEFMRRVLRDKDIVIGKQATIKFFGYTEDGSLRFCTVKNIIDYM